MASLRRIGWIAALAGVAIVGTVAILARKNGPAEMHWRFLEGHAARVQEAMEMGWGAESPLIDKADPFHAAKARSGPARDVLEAEYDLAPTYETVLAQAAPEILARGGIRESTLGGNAEAFARGDDWTIWIFESQVEPGRPSTIVKVFSTSRENFVGVAWRWLRSLFPH